MNIDKLNNDLLNAINITLKQNGYQKLPGDIKRLVLRIDYDSCPEYEATCYFSMSENEQHKK